MATRFHNPAILHHMNHIGTHSRREAVRDDQSSPAVNQRTKARQPLGLSPRIHEAGRFVENHDLRPPQKCPSQGDALPLAPTEFGAVSKPLPQQRIVPSGQTGNNLVGPGAASGSFNLRRAWCRLHITQGNVLTSRGMIVHRPLKQHGNQPSEFRERISRILVPSNVI